MEQEPRHEQGESAPVERPLLAWLEGSGPFAVLEALPILETLSGLLASLHEGGLLHDRLGPDHVAVLEHPDGACILALPEPANVKAGSAGTGASEEVDLSELGLLATLLLTGEPPIRDAQGRGPLRPLWHSNPSIPFELGVMVHALVDDASANRPTARDVHEKVKRLRRELEGAPPEPEAPAVPRRTTTAVFATTELVEQAMGIGQGTLAPSTGEGLPFAEARQAADARASRRSAFPAAAGRLETKVELEVVASPASVERSASRESETDPRVAPKSKSTSSDATDPAAPGLPAEKTSSASLKAAEKSTSSDATDPAAPGLPAEKTSSASLKAAEKSKSTSSDATDPAAPGLPTEKKSSASLKSAAQLGATSSDATDPAAPELPAEKRSSPSLKSAAHSADETPLFTGLPRAARGRRPSRPEVGSQSAHGVVTPPPTSGPSAAMVAPATKSAVDPSQSDRSAPRTEAAPASAGAQVALVGEAETAIGPRPKAASAPHPRELENAPQRATGAKLRVGGPPGADAKAFSPRTPTPVLGTPEPHEAPTIQVELTEEQLRAFVAQPPERLAQALAEQGAPAKAWKTGGLVAHPGEISLQLPPQVLAGARPVAAPRAARRVVEAPAGPPQPVAVAPWLQQPLVSSDERITPRELLAMVPIWVWWVLGGAVLLVLVIWLGTAPTDSRPGLTGIESDVSELGSKRIR